MIAQVIGWCIVVLVTAVLVRALVTGVIHYDLDGRGTVAARRDEAPGEFWMIFLIGAASDAFFLWFSAGLMPSEYGAHGRRFSFGAAIVEQQK